MLWTPDFKQVTRTSQRRLRTISSLLAARMRHARLGFTDLAAGGLIELHGIEPNPGRLRLLLHVPEPAPRAGAPLIVVLHGCGQDAAGFATAAGWIALSDRLGVPLLLPEQMEPNNRHRCFHWYRTEHAWRGAGEAASIAGMVEEAQRRLGTDPAHVFVVGLSAGGAMAAALLAAYPDLFAAGAVVAGLPVGAANGALEALARLADAGETPPDGELASRAREAGPAGHAGPWPRLSVWHGDADGLVDPRNGALLARQWAELHSATPLPPEPVPGGIRHRWGDAAAPAVEFWSLDGLGHGFPVDGSCPEVQVTRATPDMGLDAADRIARFWGIG